MKKLLFILLAIILLTGCDQIIQSSLSDPYYVNIRASAIAGTPETEFTFTANTNDIIKGWFIDRVYVKNSSINNLAYFSSLGTHTVEVITENNAYDLIDIEIYETPEEIPDFTIVKYYLDWTEVTTTDLLYVYDDYVSINGANLFYDGFDVFYSGTTKYIKIPLILDPQDEFVTRIDIEYFGINIYDMTIEEFQIIADILRRFPEESIFDLMDEYPK